MVALLAILDDGGRRDEVVWIGKEVLTGELPVSAVEMDAAFDFHAGVSSLTSGFQRRLVKYVSSQELASLG